MKINIANIPIQLNTDLDYTRYFKWAFSFRDHSNDTSFLQLDFQKDNSLVVHGEKIYKEGNIHWYRNTNSHEIALHNKESNERLGLLYADRQWKSITIKEATESSGSVIRLLSEMAFRNFILLYRGFGMHGSAINYQGNGVVFSAPSGTGKSTQAGLWEKHKNAEIFVEDRTTIRMINGNVKIFGTPWSGKSNNNSNQSFPLKAIIFLEQSPNNSIRELTQKEYLQRTMARSYLPYFDEALMQQAISNIAAIMPKVPAYLLQCRPDKEAVETVLEKLNL